MISEGEGNLNTKLETNLKAKDEISELSHAFNNFVDKIRSIVKIIKTTSRSLNIITDDIEKSMQDEYVDVHNNQVSITQIKAEIENQAGFVSKTEENSRKILEVIKTILNSLNEHKTQIDNISAQNKEIEKSASSISSIAADADTLSKKLKNAAKKGYDNVYTTIESINALYAIAGDVNASLKLINDTTESIDILSINAAIESARASEYGKGFKVIAQEIRQLARLSEKNSKIIFNSINEMDKKIQESVTRSEVSNKELQKIINMINENNEIISNIHNLIQFQVTRTGKILKSIDDFTLISSRLHEEINNQNESINEIADSIHFINNSIAEIANSIKAQHEFGEKILSRTNQLKHIVSEGKSLADEMDKLVGKFVT